MLTEQSEKLTHVYVYVPSWDPAAMGVWADFNQMIRDLVSFEGYTPDDLLRLEPDAIITPISKTVESRRLDAKVVRRRVRR